MNALLAILGKPRFGAVVLALVTALVQGGVVDHETTLDSRHFLAEDVRVREADFLALWTRGYWNLPHDDPAIAAKGADLYRPVALSWMTALWHLTPEKDRVEQRPTIVNAGNLVLHVAGVVLRYFLFLSLFGALPGAGLFAFLSALVLGVHPVASEAVATQVGCSEGLAVVLGTAGLRFGLRFGDSKSGRDAVLHAVCLLAAFLAKEHALALVVLLPLHELLVHRRGLAASGRAFLPGLVVLVLGLSLRAIVFGAVAEVGDPVLAGFGTAGRLGMALAALGTYDLMALCWPLRLLPVVTHHDLLPPSSFGDPRVLAGGGVLLLGILGVALSWRRRPLVAFGLLVAGVTWFPVSNLLVPIGALAATRFLYLPMTGLVLAAAAGVASLAGPARRAAAWATLAIVLFFAVLAVRENRLWRNEETLYRGMISRTDAPFARGNLSVVLREQGDRIARGAGGPAAAAALYDESLSYATDAAFASWPRIPGTELVPEDVLDAQYRSAVNVAIAELMHKNRLPEAKRAAARALAVAEQGSAQGKIDAGTTGWATLETEAWTLLASLDLATAVAAKPTTPEGRAALGEAEAKLARARARDPANLKPDLEAAKIVQLRDGAPAAEAAWAALWSRAVPLLATRNDAARIGFEYSQFLRRRGANERATAVLLEALVSGRSFVGDVMPYLSEGEAGARSSDPKIRAFARAALEEFLARAPATARAERQRAETLLRSLGR